jgi:exosortase E/protease (VPEID-CTERM system)
VSASSLPPAARPARDVLLYVRWAGLLALLLTELLLLSIRFDTGMLAKQSGLWARLVGVTPALLRISLAVAAAILLFGSRDLRQDFRRGAAPGGATHRWWAFLLGHFAALALFTWLTAVVLEGDLAQDGGHPAAWVAGWVVAGVAVVALAALTALPAAAWLGLLRRHWPALLVCSAVGAVAWATGLAAELFWRPLGQATLAVVRPLLGVLFPGAVVCDGEKLCIGTDTFAVTIAPECSGYEGMGLVAVFLIAYLWVFRARLRFPAALLLLPLATAGVWLLNAVRITLLIGIGTWGWPEVALGGFHSQAGWLAFLAVALGCVAVAGRSPWLAASPAAPAGRATHPTTAYLGPFLAVLLAAMIGAALSRGFDWLYPLRVLAALAVLWRCRGSYAELRGPWSWQAVGVGVAVFGLWLALAPAAAPEGGWPDALAAAPAGWSAAWLAVRVLGHVLTVPLAEELAFRGYLLRRLTTADFQSIPPGIFSWPAFLVSSLLFGLMHRQWWLAGTLAGMAFALALRRRGRLLDAVLAHATANALLAAYVLATGRWALWS